MREFEVGDIVNLKSSSTIPMTISEVCGDERVTCIWLDDSRICHERTFDPRMIEHHERDPKVIAETNERIRSLNREMSEALREIEQRREDERAPGVFRRMADCIGV